MLDTFTLLVIAILQFEVIGFSLLLAWYLSRRARALLGTSGAAMIGVAMTLLPVWYFWSLGQIRLPAINVLLVTLMVVGPCLLVVLLCFALVRVESHLRAARMMRGGNSLIALSDVAAADDLEDDLRAAMRDPGQLYVLYQPIYASSTRTLCGFEALIRWNHPQRGLISPMQFIPVAEQTQLIVPLGAWVLETACAEAALWPDDIYVSVNLSPVQLERNTLVREVLGALTRSGLAPERLELEVTEGVMVAAEGGEIARLAELRRSGVKVAIDDFGTGYSSLSYLRQMPFDTIKIDRAFVRNLEDDTGAQAIVGAIVELSRRLECKITAEGVETEAQFAILEGLNCHRIQGWLLGRAMTSEDLAQTYWPLAADAEAFNAARRA